MTGLPFTLNALRDGYRKQHFTPMNIAEDSLARIATYADPAVWITRTPARTVRARAEWLQARRNELEHLPLYGVPFAVKDNIDVKGVPTTAACPAFAYTPAADAHVVSRLLAAGAIFMGKTNLDQFATGLVGTRSPYGIPRCVFDSRYVSGGSSSGSAVAVAVGLVAFALGTDTAGSGRVPAAYNNIVGLKPTRGLISTSGIVPACRSLDCVSIFMHTVREAAAVLRVAQGYDPKDVYSRPAVERPLPISRFRFGVLRMAQRDFFGDAEVAKLYEATIQRLVSLGNEMVTVDFTPFEEAGSLLYNGAWTAERLAAIKDFMAVHEADMDPSVGKIIASARQLSAVDAFESQYRLAEARRAADKEWARMDVLVLPTAPVHDTVANVIADPIGRNARLGRYTNFVNLLDCCAIAVPAGFRSNGLPFGVTLIAPAFSDFALAKIADQVRRGSDHDRASKDCETDGAARNATRGNDARLPIFVVGAHLSGMPLNHEFSNLGGILERAARTTPDYRLFVLSNTTPPKPGLVCVPGAAGPGIEGEVWLLSPQAFGRVVASIPSPLGVGKVTLKDGSRVSGFLCEAHATENAKDITALGSWRSYVGSRTDSGP